jgi:hypothetical protein
MPTEAENVPTLHSSHVERAVALVNVPAGQSNGMVAPRTPENMPAGAGLHDDEPADALKFPKPQIWQFV